MSLAEHPGVLMSLSVHRFLTYAAEIVSQPDTSSGCCSHRRFDGKLTSPPGHGGFFELRGPDLRRRPLAWNQRDSEQAAEVTGSLPLSH